MPRDAELPVSVDSTSTSSVCSPEELLVEMARRDGVDGVDELARRRDDEIGAEAHRLDDDEPPYPQSTPRPSPQRASERGASPRPEFDSGTLARIRRRRVRQGEGVLLAEREDRDR